MRRMFSTKITEKAAFLRMPLTTQALYFHLGINADDDGIVEAFKILRMTGANEDDLKVLATKQFIKILNEDLVAYILDWNEHNLIRADRKQDSIYQGLLIKVLPEVKIKKPIERADVKKKKWTSTGQPKDGIREVKLREVKLSKEKKENNTKVLVASDYVDFKETWKKLYGKYPIGGAVMVDYPIQRLVKAYTIEKVCNALMWAEANRKTNKFIPTFNNPLELERKWNSLVDQARKEKNGIGKRGVRL